MTLGMPVAPFTLTGLEPPGLTLAKGLPARSLSEGFVNLDVALPGHRKCEESAQTLSNG
jgi:hypothetical protein